jgi:hypothetical protein
LDAKYPCHNPADSLLRANDGDDISRTDRYVFCWMLLLNNMTDAFRPPIYRAVGIECALDKKTIRLAVGKMLIAPIQSKWDAGLETVLGPWVSHRNTLRKANARADNSKP